MSRDARGPTTRERARRWRVAAPRRWVVLAIVAATTAAAAGAWALMSTSSDDSGASGAQVRRFHSRPGLDPDAVTVTVPAHRTDPGYVFLAVKRGPGQDGPQVVDDQGHVVWFRPTPPGMAATGFRVQRYRGQPVLTWWQGHTHFGHGMGEYVILDRHYRRIAVVHAGNGHRGDHHEFQLTSRGTAYLTAYVPRKLDLSTVGGSRNGTIYESLLQEVDVATGRVVWEWHSADHVPVTEGMTPPKSDRPHDYFHLNAVDVDRDGNLLLSGRNVHAIYKVNRHTGAIMWRLGGRRSDFRFGPGARFAFQHDVQRRDDGTISLFDNEATPPQADQSRGLVLRVNERSRTATLVRAYTHPDKLLAGAEGNVQTLRRGHVFIELGGDGPRDRDEPPRPAAVRPPAPAGLRHLPGVPLPLARRAARPPGARGTAGQRRAGHGVGELERRDRRARLAGPRRRRSERARSRSATRSPAPTSRRRSPSAPAPATSRCRRSTTRAGRSPRRRRSSPCDDRICYFVK